MKIRSVLMLILFFSIPVFAVKAHVYFNQTVYQINSYANMTVEDPDWNADPGSQEALYVIVNSTTSPNGIQVLLKETGPDTGVFVAENPVYLNNETTDQNSLKLRVDYGDYVYIYHEDDNNQYTDNHSSIMFNATIESDKISYTTGENATITICDYDNSNATITADAVSTYDSSSISFGLSYNSTTRCFNGHINLSTTTDDSTDRILLKEGYPVEIKYLDHTRTDGSENYSTLNVYPVMKGMVYFDSQYEYNDPSRKQYYSMNDTATIYVRDYDKNTDRNSRQSFEVNVTDSNNNSVIHVYVYETGNDTGIFSGNFTFSEINGSDISDILLVSNGDMINASYLDLLTTASPEKTWNTAMYYTTLEANITFSAYVIYPKTNLTIRINDPDRDIIGTLADGIPSKYSRVHSDSDPTGFNISFWETGNDTGIFEDSSVLFGDQTVPQNHTINITDNDYFYFTYFDCKNAFCTDNITKTVNATFRYAETARIVPNTTVVGSGDSVLVTVYDNDSFALDNPTINVVYGDSNETKNLTKNSTGTYTTLVVPDISEGQIITIYYTDQKNSSGETQIITKELKGLSNAYMNATDEDSNSVLYPNDTLVVTVKDVDRNEDEGKIENITVNMTGLLTKQYTLVETGQNTGIFRGEFLASAVASNLSVSDGSNITISYYDPHNFTRQEQTVEKNITYRLSYDPYFSTNRHVLNHVNNTATINISDPDNTATSISVHLSTSVNETNLTLAKSGSVFSGNITIPDTIGAKPEDEVKITYYDALDSLGDGKNFTFYLEYDTVQPSANYSLGKEYYGNGETVEIYFNTSEPVNITANFSDIDSNYNISNQWISGNGTHYIVNYNISSSNARPDGIYNATITLTDDGNNQLKLSIPIELFRLRASVDSINLGVIQLGQKKTYSFYLINTDTRAKNVTQKITTCQNSTHYLIDGSGNLVPPGGVCRDYADTDFEASEVDANSTKKVTLSVQIPSDGIPGNYTADIIFMSDGRNITIPATFVVSAPDIVLFSSGTALANNQPVEKKYNINTGSHTLSLLACNYGTTSSGISVSSQLSVSYNTSIDNGKCQNIYFTIPDSDSKKTENFTVSMESGSPYGNYTIYISPSYTTRLYISNTGLPYFSDSLTLVMPVKYADGSYVSGLVKDAFSFSATSGNSTVPISVVSLTGNGTYTIILNITYKSSIELNATVSDGKGNSGKFSAQFLYSGNIQTNVSCITTDVEVVEGKQQNITIAIMNNAPKADRLNLSFGPYSALCSVPPEQNASCVFGILSNEIGSRGFDMKAGNRTICRITLKTLPNETTQEEIVENLSRMNNELNGLKRRAGKMASEGYDIGGLPEDIRHAEILISKMKQYVSQQDYLHAYMMQKPASDAITKIKTGLEASRKKKTATIVAIVATALLAVLTGIYLLTPDGRLFEKKMAHKIRIWILDMKIKMKMRRRK